MKSICLIVLLFLITNSIYATPPTRPNQYVAGTNISSADVTENENTIYGYLQSGIDTLANNSVTTSNIVNGTISSEDMAASSISSTSIIDGTIASGDMAASSVSSTSIIDGTIANGDMAASSISSTNVVDGTITNDDISSTAGIVGTKLDLTSYASTLGATTINATTRINCPSYMRTAGELAGISFESDGSILYFYAGGTSPVSVSASDFSPSSVKTINSGNGTTSIWDTMWGDDFTNVADWYNFDNKKDVEDIVKIKGSNKYDEYNRELIDDSTLPEYILARHKTNWTDKDGTLYKKGEIVYTKDGKPSISLKAAISLTWGAIRELEKENSELKLRIDNLEKRIENLEKK